MFLRPFRLDRFWRSVHGTEPFSDYCVGSQVPPVFEAYARVLHPASAKGPSAHADDWLPVRWDAIAAWSGGTVHALAQFGPMARPRGVSRGARPYRTDPSDGSIPLATLGALSAVLGPHTTTPDDCYIGVWEGYGRVDRSWEASLHLRLEARTHLVREGPLSAIDEVGCTWPDGTFRRDSPSVMWPADRAWFLSNDVDLDSTYIGGSAALVEALVADRGIEAWPVQESDSVLFDSDLVNGTEIAPPD